jgi:hypothetical protein
MRNDCTRSLNRFLTIAAIVILSAADGSGPDTSARGRGAAWRRPRSGHSAAAHDDNRLGRWRRHS